MSLQSVEDSWFKTAHPLFVSPVLLTHMLRGVQVQVLPDDKTTAVRVFSDEDTEFLSPLISTALSKAAKDQLVGFRVSRGTDAESDTTGGVLYVQGRLLHLALTHYRANLNPDRLSWIASLATREGWSPVRSGLFQKRRGGRA